MYKKLTILIICLLFLSACTLQKKEIIQDETTVSNWNSDLETLVDTLESVHPNLYRSYKKEKFYQDIDSLKAALPTFTEVEFFRLSLAELLAKFDDGHTRVEQIFPTEDETHVYPLGFQWFEDELIVVGTTPEYEQLLGAKLISIKNMPLQKVISKVNTLISHDAENILKTINQQHIINADILNYLKIIDKNEIVQWKFKDQNNKAIEISITPIKINEEIEIVQLPFPKFISASSNLTKNYEGLYGYRILDGGEILYIQYNKCIDSQFEQFSEDIITTIQSENPKRIIFDLRKNGGGDSRLMTSLINKLIYQTNIRKVQNDLLIGKATFSSGVLNALEIRNKLNAKVYGEDTGENVNSFGEILYETLPFSNIEIAYSTKEYIMDKNNDGPMKPDIYCTQTYSDYENGIDTCMELLLNQSPK